MKLDDEQANPYRSPQAAGAPSPPDPEIRLRLSAGIRFLLGAAAGILAVASLLLFVLLFVLIAG